jgi:hypothetical protein
MIINAIRFYSNNVKIAEFGLDNSDHTQKYLLKEASGLDAEEIISQFVAFGGSSFPRSYDLNPIPRELVLKIKLNPNYIFGDTPSSLRDALYRAISASRISEIEVRFMNGALAVANIFGLIKKFEAPLFTPNPEVLITIKCDQSFLRGPDRTVVSLTGLSKTAPVITDGLSSAPHGFKMRMVLTGNVSSIEISEPDSQFGQSSVSYGSFPITYNFLTNDVLWFSSEQNDKYLYVVRSGVTTHLTDKLGLNPLWPIMFPGENKFFISTSSFTWQDVSYYSTFWGV